MSLQWTPIRLSMVSGQNGVTEVVRPNLRTTYRKMADFGVQVNCDEGFENIIPPSPPPFVETNSNIAVAEINTSFDPQDSTTTTTYSNNHRPLSLQSSTSSNSSGERRRLQSEEDVDAICVQQTESCAEDEPTAQLRPDTTQLDGSGPSPEPYVKEESSCGLDCVSFTMHCCECIIL